jgi:hypothetical protein
MTHSDKTKRPLRLLLVLVVLGSIATVAYADFVVTSISLGYLYVLPLALSGYVFRLRSSLALVLVCFVLQDWLGPFERTGGQHHLPLSELEHGRQSKRGGTCGLLLGCCGDKSWILSGPRSCIS